VQVLDALADVIGVDTPAYRDLGTADAGFLAADGGGERRADIFDMAVYYVLRKALR
jgi:hypothetical protein